jgi:cation transporter-like permease
MSQYLPQEGTVSIIVFKNERRTSEKAPTHNVIVTMPDGTKYEGGLFSKTSAKNGSVFHTGTLRDSRNNPYNQQRQAQSPAPANEVGIDF